VLPTGCGAISYGVASHTDGFQSVGKLKSCSACVPSIQARPKVVRPKLQLGEAEPRIAWPSVLDETFTFPLEVARMKKFTWMIA
ncbi:hypothetical protein, partial [Vibrio parahaemolyticus]|uniref:hypothetical protein n=1 Tax=Vibrio parahaemolyticus TaxID=670 RepID=UPI00301C2726